jgi:mevalonate kinase
MVKSYPAKVLLLGEYTILNGSKALALPYYDFKGIWSYETEGGEGSRQSLRAFIDNQCESYIDVARLKSDIQNGLWFDSSIPHGFGLGSSGALIAAIYDTYSWRKEELNDEKVALGKLEDFFHGSSSGLDPLVSHVQRPLLIHNFDSVEVVETPIDLTGFFLLNTGKPRQTGTLVNIYKEKLKDDQFKQSCAKVLSSEVNFAVESVLKGNHEHLFHHLWLISKFQWDFFPEMIPTKERGLWTRGLESGDYVLKLCGAGGGGYLLGYTNKLSLSDLRAVFETHEVRALK